MERERPLMEATLRIIGRKGIDGVTHRAVATEAGMSVGAVTHHFATRDALVDGALRFALTREVGRLRALALSLQSKAFDTEAWMDLAGRLVLTGAQDPARNSHRLLRGVSGVGTKLRYRPIVAEWVDTWRQSAELALRAAGGPILVDMPSCSSPP